MSAQAIDDVGSIVEPTSSLAWADVTLADFQRVVSRYLQNNSIYLFYTAEIMLKTIIMQNSRLTQACFSITIDEVWIDRFCVRYDWWRRLQPTSSVSPVCCLRRCFNVRWKSWTLDILQNGTISILIFNLIQYIFKAAIVQTGECFPIELTYSRPSKCGMHYLNTSIMSF